MFKDEWYLIPPRRRIGIDPPVYGTKHLKLTLVGLAIVFAIAWQVLP